ncbi:hypothetical protein V8G54_023898 [Vigna mungo]|uniref:Uncharacterized protein n=1 Tax=Vigna mungo TaxID=3915 RepID=A0AAQ3RQS8_VIGMU
MRDRSSGIQMISCKKLQRYRQFAHVKCIILDYEDVSRVISSLTPLSSLQENFIMVSQLTKSNSTFLFSICSRTKHAPSIFPDFKRPTTRQLNVSDRGQCLLVSIAFKTLRPISKSPTRHKPSTTILYVAAFGSHPPICISNKTL